MSIKNDELDKKLPEADFELSELEAEQVAGGTAADEGNNGCANVLASCGGAAQ